MEIKIKGLDETITYEKLDNGLEVYLYNKKTFHNNYVTFTTKFGSINTEFFDKTTNKKIKVPSGIAHFLEHKVFAQETGPEPSDYFSSNGAISNAYTTFKNTTYLFQGTEKLKENLLFLLDFVQSPYFTKENVEKEKGIITQEIHMCDDRPVNVLFEAIRKNTLHKNNFKNSIIGTIEDINKITPELLTKCYTTFYHPSNMFVVISGSFDEKEILEALAQNQKNKTFPDIKKYPEEQIKEPDTIVKPQEIIKIPTDVAKIAYTIKINPQSLNIDKRKLNIYLYILFNLLFSDVSKFDYDMKKAKIITSTLSYNLLDTDTHLLISLINETDKYEELIKEIEKNLKNININEKDFERKKKVLISNEIFSYENITLVNEMIVDNIIFDGKIEANILDIIKSLTIQELNKIITKMDLTNKNIVIIKNSEKNEQL